MDERKKVVYAKADEIVRFAEWDVNLIVDIFLEALTEANAHTLRSALEVTIEEDDRRVEKLIREQNSLLTP